MRFGKYLSLIAGALAALCAHGAFAGAHYAICVGINEYDPSIAKKKDWLYGCVSDACNIWTNITERGEWTTETARTLLNAEATKEAIRAAITNIAAIAEEGDVFLYMHSSHGGNNYYEEDPCSVFLCAYDGYYEDTELAADLAKFKSGVKVVVMVDACNSGGLFKGATAKRSLSKSDAATTAPSFNLADRVSAEIAAIRAKERPLRGLKAKGISDSEIGWITAADYNQYSWDSRYGGDFTRAALGGWKTGLCDDRDCGNENNYADFYELWNFAKDIAVGKGEPGSEYYTEAQCANSNVLLSVTAGWVDDAPPPGPDDQPRIREIKDITANVGDTVSFYVRTYSHADAPATLAIAEGNEAATLVDGVFSFTPAMSGVYGFTLSAENSNGATNEEFTVSVTPDSPSDLTIWDVTINSFRVCWTAVCGADDYLVEVEDEGFGTVLYKKVGNVTEYVVEGLSPDTTYYVWVRAYAGAAASSWSSGVAVRTDKTHVVPAWADIPVIHAQVGRPFALDLSNFVTGWPMPGIELVKGDATIEGTRLSFTPTATGELSFTVSASNHLGVAEASVSVDVGELAPKKFALCVGINEYKEITSLYGCVNDAKYMAANLVARGGWDAADITILTDERATKSAIRGAISNIVVQAMAGDTFVYQHSSHGGQFNAGYDILYGEDGKDVFLCVFDERLTDNTTAYNDYEIAADLAAFPSGVKVAMIVDACHSGGLFKSPKAAKAAAESFNLAERVSAIMDAYRTRRRARGENVSGSLSPEEVGWATAAEYYETSSDGGFYHTDKWLTDAMYGEEYWDYPENYREGGVFTASATWGWWNGDADEDADGSCDVYEFWKKGYDFCSVVGEFWYDDPDYSFHPQCTNVTVLQSIELGWVKNKADPLPDLSSGATPELVASALAGGADNALIEHITDTDTYSAYRDWAQGIGVSSVCGSTCAWLSFALGSDALVRDDISGDDIKVVLLEPSSEGDGGVVLAVEIDGVSVGSANLPEEMLLANLAEVFGIEGADTPDTDLFESDDIEVRVGTPQDGKAILEAVTPDADSFFFRVRLDW